MCAIECVERHQMKEKCFDDFGHDFSFSLLYGTISNGQYEINDVRRMNVQRFILCTFVRKRNGTRIRGKRERNRKWQRSKQMTASTWRMLDRMNMISLPVYWSASNRHKSHALAISNERTRINRKKNQKEALFEPEIGRQHKRLAHTHALSQK